MKDWTVAFIAAVCSVAFVAFCSYIILWAMP